MKKVLEVFLSFLLLFLPHAPTSYAKIYNIIQLTDNSYNDCRTEINGVGQVVWQSWCEAGDTGEIFLYNGTSIEQLTDNDRVDWEVDINDNGMAVWVHYSEDSHDIWIYDGTTSRLFSDDPGVDDFPYINNNNIVTWEKYTDGDHEVMISDGVTPSQLTANTYPDRYPKINDNGYVVWSGWDPDAEIFLYDGTDTAQLTDNDFDDYYQQINNNGQVVWRGGECPFSCEIYFYDGVSTQQLTTNFYDDHNPRINDNGQVVWWGYYGDVFQTFLYNGATVKLGDNARYPDINNSGHVVWQELDGNDLDIFVYDGSTTTQITNDCSFDDQYPKISDNGAIVWERHDGSDSEIMIASPLSSPEKQWAKAFGGFLGDAGKSVRPAMDGGYIGAGSTRSFGAVESDIWVVTLDPDGNIEAQRTYGGADEDTAASIQVAPDGGYILAGTTRSFGAGQSDIWVLKLDNDGNVAWQKTYGGALDETAVFVDATNDCGFIVGGITTTYGAGESDYWLLKLDDSGNVMWQKTYGGTSIDTLGSGRRTRDGGYILSGKTFSFGLGSGDFQAIKLDQDGNIEWQKTYGTDTAGIENSENEPLIRQTEDGGFILAGDTAPLPAGNQDAWVLKLDDAGEIEWQKYYETGGDYGVYALQQTPDLGYVLAGAKGTLVGIHNTGDGWIMKLSAAGNVEWQNTYGGSEVNDLNAILSLEPASDGGFIAAGLSDTFDISDGGFWVLKLDAAGQVPNCPAIHSWTGSEADTFEAALNSAVTAADTGATVNSTSVSAVDVNAYLSDGCRLSVYDLIDLPKTGQATDYHAGDDGDIEAGVLWPSPRFTDNLDGTFIDNLTGLIWLQDANCAHTIDHDPDGSGNGSMTWERSLDFVAGINNGTHDISTCASYTASHADWRAPNINELESLINAGEPDPGAWLNEEGFINVVSQAYWSSTTHVFGMSYAIVGELATGRIVPRRKSDLRYAWPVRAGQMDHPDNDYPANIGKTGEVVCHYPGDDGDLRRGTAWPSPRFINNLDGTVTDRLTGLMWLKDAACFGDQHWEESLDAISDFNMNPTVHGCADYTASYTDWRMANRKEYNSLVDWSQYGYALPDGAPFVNVPSSYLWSSNTTANESVAWGFYMITGTLIQLGKQLYSYNSWPVRGGSQCGMPSTRIDSTYFTTLQDACDAAENGDTIQAHAATFENLDLCTPISITIEGGYDCYYETKTGFTDIDGILTITSGSLTIERISIQ